MLLGVVYTILNRLQLYIYTIPVAGTVPPVMLCLDALGRRWVGDCNYVLKAVNAWCFWNVLGALATHEPSLQNSAVHAPLNVKRFQMAIFEIFWNLKIWSPGSAGRPMTNTRRDGCSFAEDHAGLLSVAGLRFLVFIISRHCHCYCFALIDALLNQFVAHANNYCAHENARDIAQQYRKQIDNIAHAETSNNCSYSGFRLLSTS